MSIVWGDSILKRCVIFFMCCLWLCPLWWTPLHHTDTSVCTIAGLWVRRVLTVWKRSTTPSYLILSRTMLRVINTPVLPTPALVNIHYHYYTEIDHLKLLMSDFDKQTNYTHTLSYLQWTVMGPSCPNCSLVLCTWPMKSMNPSPVFGTPCSGQSVNWNCLMVLDWPSWLMCRKMERKKR